MHCTCGGVLSWDGDSPDSLTLFCSMCDSPSRISNDNCQNIQPSEDEAARPRVPAPSLWPMPMPRYRIAAGVGS